MKGTSTKAMVVAIVQKYAHVPFVYSSLCSSGRRRWMSGQRRLKKICFFFEGVFVCVGW